MTAKILNREINQKINHSPEVEAKPEVAAEVNREVVDSHVAEDAVAAEGRFNGWQK